MLNRNVIYFVGYYDLIVGTTITNQKKMCIHRILCKWNLVKISTLQSHQIDGCLMWWQHISPSQLLLIWTKRHFFFYLFRRKKWNECEWKQKHEWKLMKLLWPTMIHYTFMCFTLYRPHFGTVYASFWQCPEEVRLDFGLMTIDDMINSRLAQMKKTKKK